MSQYITITSSKQNPCDFVSNFADAVNLYDGYEVAVTKIFHAPAYNITSSNNKFSLAKGTKIENYRIPIGFYAGTCHIMAAINDVLVNSVLSDLPDETLLKRNPTFSYKQGGDASSLQIHDSGVFFAIEFINEDKQLLGVLGYCVDGRIKRLDINHYNLSSVTEVGFLYSNIVANSIINQQQSHLLSLIPITSKNGYNYHEFTNPAYRPLSVHSFTDIDFALTNVRGDIIEMDHLHSADSDRVVYPTVITLHIRKIYK